MSANLIELMILCVQATLIIRVIATDTTKWHLTFAPLDSSYFDSSSKQSSEKVPIYNTSRCDKKASSSVD